MGTSSSDTNAVRAQYMRLFALSDWSTLRAATANFADETHQVIRAPEVGMLMLRGRMGATGAAFNQGEATVTRCTVKLADGTEGHSYILGRNLEHAHRAALCDAFFQKMGAGDPRCAQILVELETFIAERRQNRASKAAATKVDFFTMVRGDV
jgi:alpha-D-ribose 1-methylphosphonate 5-triphosphate synthase subunit PhnG